MPLTPVFFTSFGALSSLPSSVFNQTSGVVQASTVRADGTKQVQFTSNSTADQSMMGVNPAASYQTTVFGFRFKIDAHTAIAHNGPFRILSGANTSALRISINSSGKLQAYDDANNLLGTATTAISAGTTWTYIEVAAYAHSTQGRVTIRQNGVTELSLTNVRTSPDNAFKVWRFANLRYFNFYITDVYQTTDTVDTPFTFLGDVRCELLAPTSDDVTYADLAKSSGSNGWELIDEVPFSTTDHVNGTVSGQKSVFGYADLSSTDLKIHGVNTWSGMIKESGGLDAKPLLLSGGTLYPQSTVAVGTALTHALNIYATDPATGAAWTPANVNAVKAGMEVA